MKVLLKQAHITDPDSPLNGTRNDILIDSGIVRKISLHIEDSADHVVSAPSLQVSPGWIDIFSNFADPGFEFKETLETGAMAAAAGGFTDVFVIPNTKPATDTKSQVEYIGRASASPVSIHPIGAISKKCEGKDLAEMYDMHASGAIAFSDGTSPVQSAGLLLKALQYVKAIDAVIIQVPDDHTIGTSGLMNEGVVSTRLGLPGKPMMAEELLIARDIKLARYSESKIHFTGVTSPKSLEYIRRAKDGGLSVTCSVTPYHLIFSDEDLQQYDTNLKVFPPLRRPSDRQYLIEAVKDGTVDCIATHHMPHEYDSKEVEFEHARFGMIGLETCFPALNSVLDGISNERKIDLLSINARKIFGLPVPSVREGLQANFTLYSYEENSLVINSFLRSRSRNSPFIGKELPGRVLGIINNEALFLT